MKTPRQAAKEQKAFFTKFEINGNYLPKKMQEDGWGGKFISEGPTHPDRRKDLLAITLFAGRTNVSLYECLVDAGRMLKNKK